METALGWVLFIIEIYLAIGIVFAIPFALRGAGRIDPAARQATWGFRLVILPGSAALWPFLAWRWYRAGLTPPDDADEAALSAREEAA